MEKRRAKTPQEATKARPIKPKKRLLHQAQAAGPQPCVGLGLCVRPDERWEDVETDGGDGRVHPQMPGNPGGPAYPLEGSTGSVRGSDGPTWCSRAYPV